MKLERVFGVAISVSLVASCSTSSATEDRHRALANRHTLAMDRCASAGFKTALQKANCYNSADQLLMGTVGADADLLQYRMAKRIDVAKKIDSGKISRDAGNAEITSVYAQVQSESQRRTAQRLVAVAKIMQSQQQNNTLSDMARSQRRMADALDDANDIADPSRRNDPYRWAKMYGRGY